MIDCMDKIKFSWAYIPFFSESIIFSKRRAIIVFATNIRFLGYHRLQDI